MIFSVFCLSVFCANTTINNIKIRKLPKNKCQNIVSIRSYVNDLLDSSVDLAHV